MPTPDARLNSPSHVQALRACAQVPAVPRWQDMAPRVQALRGPVPWPIRMHTVRACIHVLVALGWQSTQRRVRRG